MKYLKIVETTHLNELVQYIVIKLVIVKFVIKITFNALIEMGFTLYIYIYIN